MPAASDRTVATIDDFLREVGGFMKAAEQPLSEPGSVGGETSHPVKDVDDRLQEPVEGERFKENTSDVKKDQGAVSVQSAPDNVTKTSAASLLARFAKAADGGSINPPGAAADDQLQIGMNAQPTGEDSSHETGSVKADKEDGSKGGPSSHPARTDNDSLDGNKYAADLASMSLEKLAAEVRELGNDLCAALTVQAHAPAQKVASAAPAAKPSPEAAMQAGWELAGLVGGDKRAVDAMVKSALFEVAEAAYTDGNAAADCLDRFLQEKQAEGGPPPGPGAPPPGAGGPSPGGGGEELMAALGGGAGGPPPGAGGPPPPGAGGPPPGAGGPPPGGEEGGKGEPDGDEGGAGGPVSPEELLQLLQQLGVTPEELQAALSQAPVGGHQVAASDKTAAAKAGNADKATVDLLTELLARSRKGGR